jgi:transposase
MIRGGFLSEEDRNKLIALAREGSVASRVTRRANALVLLDDGWSCQEVADAFLLNDDTIRGWFKLFEQRGIEGLTSFDVGGSASFLSAEQEDALKAFVGATLPRSTRQVGAFIEQEFGLVYESRSGLIALLHRLGLEYHKPDIIPRKLNKEKQQAFIESYDNLLNSLADNEAVLFADAVHPTHAARPAGCWAPRQEKLAIEQTSGRDRSRDRPDPDDRGRNRRRRLDDQAPGIDRGALSDVGAHPCLSRQRALSSRQAGAGMACATRVPDQAAFHPVLLPASQSDRAVVGPHAQKRHAQQMLRHMRPIRRCDAWFPA